MSTATVRFHLPAPELRGAISTYYILRALGPGVVEDIMNDGRRTFFVNAAVAS